MVAKRRGTFCLVLTLLLGLLLFSGSAAWGEPPFAEGEQEDLELRTWTDATGTYRTEAALIDFADGQVRLKKEDGKVISVSMERLSEANRRYVRRELARRAARRDHDRRSPPEAAVPSHEWPGWRGPKRDGKSPDRGLLKEWPAAGPKLLWKADGIGKGFSSVAVSRASVYITGDVGNELILFALDLDGTPQWKVNHGSAWTKNHPGARSTPMIDGGNLYLVSGDGLLGCYDVKTGRRKWTRQMREFGGSTPGWGYAESVLIYDNLAVVTPGGNNCIVALDKTSGRPLWASQGFAAAAQYGSCYAFTHEGVPMIVTGTRSGIVCVDARSGRALWANPFSANNTANCPTPVFSDGYVFWANGYGKGGICLKLAVSGGRVSADVAWTTNDMNCHHGGYIVHDGYIYGNHSSGWVCLELKTGQKMWQERGVGKGSICFADGMLYLFGENGGRVGLATCSPQGFQMKGSFAVQGNGPSWAHPVVVGGRLYVRYDSNLYCYNVRAEGQ